jgi:hypothetical protein
MTLKYEIVSLPIGASPFMLKRRQIPDAIRASLGAAVPVLPDEIFFETTRDKLLEDISLALRSVVPSELRQWLSNDISDCAEWLVNVARCGRIGIRLEKMTDRMCPKFHVDSVPLRLLCTYQGPGTEWTDPNTAYSINFDEPYDETLLHHFPAGSITIYGGSQSLNGLKPLWHRSPAVAQGDGRLLLCIDPIV